MRRGRAAMSTPRVAHLDEIAPVPCPCGSARRAFVAPDSPASIHVVDIARDARAHHHERHTEIYLVLEVEGHVELDGELVPVRPLTAILIPPGCRHRAVGSLRIVNVSLPPFDPADERLD